MFPEKIFMREHTILSRRNFLRAGSASALALSAPFVSNLAAAAETHFKTRGVVLVPSDITTWPWPQRAQQAGLNTIGTHITPRQVAAFVATEAGAKFLEDCRRLDLEVEHELHAMSDLLPRDLFKKNPKMFRMNDKGERVADYNICVHSRPAIEVACENAVKYAKLLRPTTGRYFYWIDDGKPMCCCPKCRDLSDSDQALIFENHLLGALRKFDRRATLAHLVYINTLTPPTQIKPEPGIFVEFAPYRRRYDMPLKQRDGRLSHTARTHGEQLDLLDANLDIFGIAGAQVLEYWIDVSRFAGFVKQDPRPKIPWNEEVFLSDLDTYGNRGIRNITSFAVRLDGPYVKRHGEPPLKAYGQGLKQW